MMQTIRVKGLAEAQPSPPCVATIGFFDGVHAGHRFLLEELKQAAQSQGLPSAVITFAQHPRQVLQTDYRPQLLSTVEEKLALLGSTGVDYCFLMDFTPELAALSARQFISEVLSCRMQVQTLLIGYDHRFGHDRTDGFEEYTLYGSEVGMRVQQAQSFSEGKISASSSVVRHSLEAGDVSFAAKILTSPYTLTGTVVHGHQMGRTIGFPTANIKQNHPPKLCPLEGVYAVEADIADGSRHKGMLYIGNRPTLDNGEKTIEVHILDFEGDLYNQAITVRFLSSIRPSIRFASIEALRLQLEEDKNTIENFFDTL